MFDQRIANEDWTLPPYPTPPVYGKSVLITGASGSFGYAFVKRCLNDGARRVVVFSRDEAKQAKMRALFGDGRLRFFVGDVRNYSRIVEACRGVDIVIHAAAMKRVETCEENPSEAILTNVTGTENVAKACIAANVRLAVMLSTDKAAAPNTIYGATKLCAERLWIASNVYAAGTPTRFAASRYGNVCGSTGSVIPLWRAQAARGVLTVTDPTMSRFWMPMEDAVNLVVLALKEMRGGEIFIPKIGAASILALAEAIAPDATLNITGTRPGEKMHETLISKEESRNAYDAGTHYIIEPETRTWGDVAPLKYPKVPEGFEYASHTNPRKLTAEELRGMAA